MKGFADRDSQWYNSTTTNSEGYFKFADVAERDAGTKYHLKIIVSSTSYPSAEFYLTGDLAACFNGQNAWLNIPEME